MKKMTKHYHFYHFPSNSYILHDVSFPPGKKITLKSSLSLFHLVPPLLWKLVFYGKKFLCSFSFYPSLETLTKFVYCTSFVPLLFHFIYVVWVQFLGGERARARLILVLREFIWSAPAVSLVLPAIDDTGSLGSPPRQMVYPPV